MCNEVIKAPEIEGFEVCTTDEWMDFPTEDTATLALGIGHAYHYRRIKPKEKSIKEIISECYKEPFLGEHPLVQCFERILENYIKKDLKK